MCLCALGSECESVLGGFRPADSQRPAICPGLRATVERSGRARPDLCGQPTYSDSQEPAGTNTHTHPDTQFKMVAAENT